MAVALVLLWGAGPLAAQAPTLTDQSLRTNVLFIGVHPVSPDVVWISGTRGAYARTTDGGRTWNAGFVPGADSLQFRDVHAFDENTAWLLSIGNGQQSRIYHTADGGRTWSIQFVSTDERAFFDCFSFWDRNRGLAVSDALGREFLVLRTENGGRTWERIPPTAFPAAREGEGMFAASGTCLVTKGTQHAWIGTGAGRIARVLRTTDGGRTWHDAPTPIVQNTESSGITSLAFFDFDRGMALGGDLQIADRHTSNVAVTLDGGTTWVRGGQMAFPGPVYGGAVVPGKERTVVAVGPAGAAWTADGGLTWERIEERTFWSVGFAENGTGWMVGPEGRIVKVEWK